MKRILLLLLLASSAHATTRTAASCSVANIQTQNALSTDGDTILVPGGSSTWTTALNLNSGVTLNGQGCAVTFSGSGVLQIATDATASTVVTGFTFNTCLGANGSIGITLASGPPYNKLPRLYNNTISDATGGNVICLSISGLGPALIDHNTISASNASEVFHILGNGAGCVSCWTEDVVPGGSDMVFIENNTFTNVGSGAGMQAEEAFYGAVFVLRFNHLNAGTQNDIHGSGPPSGRWVEAYSNTYSIFNAGFNLSSYINLRGGSGLYYNNHSTGSPCCSDPFPGTAIGPLCSSSDICGTWPVQYQLGRGINGTTYSPAYIGGNDTIIQSAVASTDPSMVQIGTAPTDATNCSGHAGNVCDAVTSVSAPSSIEVCQTAAQVTGGCPATITYTAFTYPHPQDNCLSSQFGSGATCTGSAAPPALAGTMFAGNRE